MQTHPQQPAASKAAQRPQCFIMMPFSDPEGYDKAHFQRVYKHLIFQACERAGLEPIHLMEARGATLITADIVRLVTEAPMALCDLSARNPNVMFELGLRQAARKPVVLIKDERTDKIFDVDALRTIPYHHSLRADLVEDAITAIAAALTQTLKDDAKGNVVYLVDLASAAQVHRQLVANDSIVKQFSELKQWIASQLTHRAPRPGAAPRESSATKPKKPAQGAAAPPRGIGPAIQKRLWAAGSTLRVRFLSGTKAQHAAVQKAANTWAQYANIHFKFVKQGESDIRVAFKSDDGNWSYMGTDAKAIPNTQPTMNVAFMDHGEPLKEFGHALGLIQEHQNPNNGMRWNRKVVLKQFRGPPNHWSDETIEHNLLSTYKAAELGDYREFDPKSIMAFSFPATWTTDGRGTGTNTELSASDKTLIAKLYPGRPKSDKG